MCRVKPKAMDFTKIRAPQCGAKHKLDSTKAYNQSFIEPKSLNLIFFERKYVG